MSDPTTSDMYGGFYIRRRHTPGDKCTPHNSIFGFIDSLNDETEEVSIAVPNSASLMFKFAELTPIVMSVGEYQYDYEEEDIPADEAWEDIKEVYNDLKDGLTLIYSPSKGVKRKEPEIVEDSTDWDKKMPYVFFEGGTSTKYNISGYVKEMKTYEITLLTPEESQSNKLLGVKFKELAIWKSDLKPESMIALDGSVVRFDGWHHSAAWNAIGLLVPKKNQAVTSATSGSKHTTNYQMDKAYEEKMRREHEPMLVCFNVT